MIVNGTILVGVKQFKGLPDFLFLLVREFRLGSPLLATFDDGITERHGLRVLDEYKV